MSNENLAAPALPRPLLRRHAATLRGFLAPVPPPRPERAEALARRVDAALRVTACLLVALPRVLARRGRYLGADAAGDLACVETSGVSAADLERWAAAGADVLAGCAS